MKDVIDYLQKTLGAEIHMERLGSQALAKLPVYLKEMFRLYRSQLMGRDLILAELPDNRDFATRQIRIQLQRITEAFDATAIFVARKVSWTKRARLIENRVNFIVPGRQLYLPDLMIDLRERFNTQSAPKDTLLPSAQIILLYWILRRAPEIESFTQKQLATELNYSPMTITNAVANLTHLNLCEIAGKRPKRLTFRHPRPDIWRQSLTLMTNPVTRIVFTDSLPKKLTLYKSNITALADYTEINEGSLQHFAVRKQDFSAFMDDHNLAQLTDSEGRYALELWKYDPGILAEGIAGERIVDPLSLYLSLRGTSDERIEKALDNLIGGKIW